MKRLIGLLVLGLALLGGPVLASNCPTYPYNLTNGQTADANQVMADFNSILTCANTTLLGSPISGSVISTGTIPSTALAAGVAVANLGYTPLNSTSALLTGLPQNSKSAAYTLVIGDAGQEIYHPSADTTARIWTIPANASVAYAVATKIEIVNDCSAGVLTLSITSDTLEWFPSGGTGSRTLAACGIATLTKITSTEWAITGAGLN